LHITEGQAGQAIAISGAFALLASLFISTVVGRTDRKRLPLSMSLLMMVSGTGSDAAASDGHRMAESEGYLSLSNVKPIL